jgi:hypothetical protein
MLSYSTLKDTTHLCGGVRPGHGIPCNGTLYKCTACGATGCRQTYEGNCTKQGFSVAYKCLKCGVAGKYEMLALPGPLSGRTP